MSQVTDRTYLPEFIEENFEMVTTVADLVVCVQSATAIYVLSCICGHCEYYLADRDDVLSKIKHYSPHTRLYRTLMRVYDGALYIAG